MSRTFSPQTQQDAAPTRTLWIGLVCLLGLNAVLWSNQYFNVWDPSHIALEHRPNLAIEPASIQIAQGYKKPMSPPPTQTNTVTNAVTNATKNNTSTGACLLWTNLSMTDAQAINRKATQANIPLGNIETVAAQAGFMIVMGPYPNRVAIDQKIVELKRINVKEYAVIDGKEISLGVFSTEQAAKNQFESLRKLGVRTARIMTRTTQLNKTQLRFLNLNAEQLKSLKSLNPALGKLVSCT